MCVWGCGVRRSARASLRRDAPAQVATPANWKNGDDVFILPSVSDEDASEAFPKGFTTIKPYLRLTPAPDVEGEA